jgi:hypothetical protein
MLYLHNLNHLIAPWINSALRAIDRLLYLRPLAGRIRSNTPLFSPQGKPNFIAGYLKLAFRTMSLDDSNKEVREKDRRN